MRAGLAEQLGLPLSAGTAQIKGGVNGISNTLRVAILPELKLGDTLIRNLVLLIFDDKDLLLTLGPDFSYQIDAILGYPAFDAIGSVEFKDGEVVLGAHGSRRSSQSRLFLNQLKLSVECGVDGRQIPFAFDTGADRSTFTVRYFHEFGEQFEGLTRAATGYGGVGGIVSRDAFVLPQAKLQLAGNTIVLKDVVTYPFALGTDTDKFYGNLGRDVIAEFRAFQLDFRRMVLSLE